MPPNDAELADLDPVSLMDEEAARLERHFDDLPEADWSRPSRCEGWTVRDVLAHLAATEQYHHACLEGQVRALMQDVAGRGATDVAAFNQLGIDDLADTPTDEILRQWVAADAKTRAGFRARGNGDVDTSVGDYPARWQAFHLAMELATHADDAWVAIPVAERAPRRDWRARFSRFALAEHSPELSIDRVNGDRTRVTGDGVDAVLDDDDFIEVVAGREPAGQVDAAVRARLSTMP